MTVLESLQLSTDFLEKKGIESPRLNAELLLSEILKCKRLDLYLKFDQPLKENEVDIYREWITRRGKFEPLQYIIGNVEFYGLPFKVTPDVLIPRPETEILVEEVIKFCKDKPGLKILDIGTGSGNISISLAKNLDNVEIIAVDISEKALSIARENAVANRVEEKIHFITADVKNYVCSYQFDIIVSNPPYVSKEEYPILQNEIKNYEPMVAVTDSSDGLDLYRTIAERAQILFKNNGKIFLEVGKDQEKFIADILEKNDFINIYFVKDYQQIDRVVVGELK
ncbi:MAG: peptide chain release factor N(5)-glutamine methyltransferase [Ignavibacteriales bacterium]|nr:peptide chain release factor N(5)-glutamine methyltransferase [Ignavibacteriales bacterium]